MQCVGLFTASSLLCGLAWNLNWLILFQVLQGLGGGGLAPSEQSILADACGLHFAPHYARQTANGALIWLRAPVQPASVRLCTG